MNQSRKRRGAAQWLRSLAGLSLLVVAVFVSASNARAQANPSTGLVLTPATFAILNPSVFGDNGAVVVGGSYGNRPNAKSYLFSGSLSHVRFQFGRTFWPNPSRVKTLMTGLDYAHGLTSANVNSAIKLVSGVQASVGYGLINDLTGIGNEGTSAGILLATGARFSGPGFRLTPYVSPAYFFARQAIVGFGCGQPDGCAGRNVGGFRFSFGGGLRLDVLGRLSLEAGVRKTQTPDAISRRSFGASYRFGNLDVSGLRDAGSFTLQMDNDFLARYGTLIDEDYTQGFHFTFNRKRAPRFLDRMRSHLDRCSAEEKCVVTASVLAGQEIYTPQYVPTTAPDDRPYGGWLYGGMRSSAGTDADLTTLGIKLGVTGPPSLAQQLQVTFHELQPYAEVPGGWKDQIRFEPGIILTAEKKKFAALRAGAASIGLLPSGSVSLGNILTDLEAGLAVRGGINAWHPWMIERQHGFGVHGSFGARGDLVLRNLFLDGNTFRSGPRVKHLPFAWQKELGIGVSFGSLSLDYQRTVRSKEFTTGRAYHPFGTIALTRRGQF